MRLKKPLMATDEQGHEVLLSTTDTISEISDAGPIEGEVHTPSGKYLRDPKDAYLYEYTETTGWNVAFRVTNLHWSEIVTCDAVKLLRALE